MDGCVTYILQMFFQSKHGESAPGQSFDKENNVVKIYNFIIFLKIY